MAELEVCESQLESNNRIMTKGEGVKTLSEPRREKTGFLHMRKQRRRSASR